MGGRGASSGMSVKNIPYGMEYKTLFKVGNIKFIVPRGNVSVTAPMETMTANRVYVTVGKNGPKHISYYGKDNKRRKQIDLTHIHQNMKPHTHNGYEHNEFDGKKGARNLTKKEREMVDRVWSMWYSYNNK